MIHHRFELTPDEEAHYATSLQAHAEMLADLFVNGSSFAALGHTINTPEGRRFRITGIRADGASIAYDFTLIPVKMHEPSQAGTP